MRRGGKECGEEGVEEGPGGSLGEERSGKEVGEVERGVEVCLAGEVLEKIARGSTRGIELGRLVEGVESGREWTREERGRGKGDLEDEASAVSGRDWERVDRGIFDLREDLREDGIALVERRRGRAYSRWGWRLGRTGC